MNLGEQFPTQHQRVVTEPTVKLSLKPVEKLKWEEWGEKTHSLKGVLPEIRIDGQFYEQILSSKY